MRTLLGLLLLVLGASCNRYYATPKMSQRSAQALWIKTDVVLKPAPPEDIEKVPGRLLAKPSAAGLDSGLVSEADVRTWPFKNVGKLIVRGPLREDCTAQFAGSEVLLTAAHCLHDGRDWIRNPSTGNLRLEFYRALRGTSYAQFVSATCAAVPAQWANGAGGNSAYDYAFIRTAAASSAGSLALRVGLPYATWTAVGYPFDYGNGLVLARVTGALGSANGGVAEMLQNPLSRGASGGAWIGDLNSSQLGNEIIGVNGRRAGSSMKSPLFTSEVIDLYSLVEQGCPP